MAFTRETFARGFLLGAAVAGSAGVVIVLMLLATGTTSKMMGALAEVWTAQELRRLRRRGWRVVNHVSLRPWNIDHVLIGPGGVFAVETKWASEPWNLDRLDSDDQVLRAVEQVLRNARDLRLWQEFKTVGITAVEAVVVLWGATCGDAGTLGVVQQIGGVTVVDGPHLRDWLDGLPSEVTESILDENAIAAAWNVLDRHARQRDQHGGDLQTRGRKIALHR